MDWPTIASLGTAIGTLVLAIATFVSVVSGRRAARVAERALLARTQPILAPSRTQDPETKIGFQDNHFVRAAGGAGIVEVTESVIYMAISVRNVGPGLAVLHSWSASALDLVSVNDHADLNTFHRLTRDLYVPVGDIGFWQGALRDPTTEEFATIAKAASQKQRITVDILYGDHEGGQRVITRFLLTPHDEQWLATVARYWNIDRADPR
ncbi:MAG TPA: hypothetical protein VNV65_08725 [Candidatus Solibacter sp.]|jgi:hypothetical protein|nr:hypothetical protein [Candidatus Solibacter sp.]